MGELWLPDLEQQQAVESVAKVHAPTLVCILHGKKSIFHRRRSSRNGERGPKRERWGGGVDALRCRMSKTLAQMPDSAASQ